MSPVPGRGFWYVPVLWVMLGSAAVAAAPGCHGAGLGLSPPRLLLCVALQVVPCPLTVLWDPPLTGWLAGKLPGPVTTSAMFGGTGKGEILI